MTPPAVDPAARCRLCHHREDQHETLPDGTRPCRSIGHEKGLTCTECRRLIGAEHFEAVMALRDEPDDEFEVAWAAYYATFNHARDEIGPGWQAFFTDVHQSALASALVVLREQQGDIGERLAVAVEARLEADPRAFECSRCEGDTSAETTHWLRTNASAVLAAPPDAAHYVETREYRVIGAWGTSSSADEAAARENVEQARAFSPPISARAEWRLVRTWPDGAAYTGPWQPLTGPEA